MLLESNSCFSVDKRFTVQWDQVHNHDHVNGKLSSGSALLSPHFTLCATSDGPFTFQLTLFPSGLIYFVYREVSSPQIDTILE